MLYPIFSIGQAFQDTSFVRVAKANTIKLYTQNYNSYADLFNGKEYIEYKQVESEHPYLNLNWIEGKIEYGGKLFQNVPLLYDVSKDEIITEHSSGGKIALIKERVHYFSFEDKRFEYLTLPELKTGFYQILYSGSVRIISRTEKSRQEVVKDVAIHPIFETQVKYYLIKDSKATLISNKRSLIKAITENNPELKKKLASVDIDAGLEKQKLFAKLAALYDSLNAQQ